MSRCLAALLRLLYPLQSSKRQKDAGPGGYYFVDAKESELGADDKSGFIGCNRKAGAAPPRQNSPPTWRLRNVVVDEAAGPPVLKGLLSISPGMSMAAQRRIDTGNLRFPVCGDRVAKETSSKVTETVRL